MAFRDNAETYNKFLNAVIKKHLYSTFLSEEGHLSMANAKEILPLIYAKFTSDHVKRLQSFSRRNFKKIEKDLKVKKKSPDTVVPAFGDEKVLNYYRMIVDAIHKNNAIYKKFVKVNEYPNISTEEAKTLFELMYPKKRGLKSDYNKIKYTWQSKREKLIEIHNEGEEEDEKDEEDAEDEDQEDEGEKEEEEKSEESGIDSSLESEESEVDVIQTKKIEMNKGKKKNLAEAGRSDQTEESSSDNSSQSEEIEVRGNKKKVGANKVKAKETAKINRNLETEMSSDDSSESEEIDVERNKKKVGVNKKPHKMQVNDESEESVSDNSSLSEEEMEVEATKKMGKKELRKKK